MDNKLYNKALIWLEKSDYDIVPILDKNVVRFDLMYKEKVIKSDKVAFSVHFVATLQDKIIKLYQHFNDQNRKINS